MTEPAGAVEQPEPLVGVVALRSFTVSVDGYLMPITFVSRDWRAGTCIASCRAGDHPAPDSNCRCGVYAVKTVAQLEQAAPVAAARLIAVVALEGQTIEGDYGYRTQAARVLDIWVCPGWRGLPAAQVALLRSNYPDITFHTDLAGMIARYPQLPSVDSDVQSGLVRRALRARLAVGLGDLWVTVRPAVGAIESSLTRAVGLYLMALIVIVLKERSAGVLSAVAQVFFVFAVIALSFAAVVGRTGWSQVSLCLNLVGKARSALRVGSTMQAAAMLLAAQWEADISAGAWLTLGLILAFLAAVSVLQHHLAGKTHPVVLVGSGTRAAIASVWGHVAEPGQWVPAGSPSRWARQGIRPVYIGSSRSPRR